MTSSPHTHLAVLREAQDRALEAEGIPMVLVLLDHRATDHRATGGRATAAQDDGVRAEGERLAGALEEVREALLPGHRGSDLGATTAALQAVSYADFGRTVDASERLGGAR